MPAKKYRIKLEIEERRHLESIVRKQKVAASKRSKANALLLSDENVPGGAIKDEVIAERTGMSVNTIARLRRDCCETGPLEALERKVRLTPPIPSKIDGQLEARLTAEACSPEQARRLAMRFEVHYTPKHGSWLNIAEIEISVLARACLNRRIPSKDVFLAEVTAFLARKNGKPSPTRWRFTCEDSRIKLASLYP